MAYNKNSTILAAAWEAASTDYQQNVPAPSQGTMAEVIQAFNEPNAGKYFNEITGLFNTIGLTRIKSRRFENPLEFLEGAYLRYGHSIREIAVRWAKAHSFDSEAQTLLKRNLPDFVEMFYSIDRFDRYDTSISRTEFIQSLQPGIGNEDGNGLDTLLGAIFDSVYSPEAYDSMRYTLQCIAEADTRWNDGRGLHREYLAEITDKDTGEDFMAAIEGLALRWQFPSSVYNNVDNFPVFVRPEELVLLVQPETLGLIDFKTIANLFHEERAEDVRRRIVVVPDFPIPNCRAILTTRDFFVIHRSVYQLENFYNPQQIVTNYYLHSQGVWAPNPLAPICLFGDFEPTEIATATVAPTGLTLTPFADEVEQGGAVQIRATLDGAVSATPEGADTGAIMVKPDSVIWQVAAEGVTLDRNTFVDRFGILHVGKKVEAGTSIVVTGTSTYINPSDETEEYTATATVTVVAPTVTHDNTEEEQLAYTDIRDAVLSDDAIGGESEPVNP